MSAAGNRAVVVRLHVPSGDGFPDTPELVGLAETLHELARDLVPGASSSAEVEVEPGGEDPARPGTVYDLDELRAERRARRAAARAAEAAKGARDGGRGTGRRPRRAGGHPSPGGTR